MIHFSRKILHSTLEKTHRSIGLPYVPNLKIGPDTEIKSRSNAYSKGDRPNYLSNFDGNLF